MLIPIMMKSKLKTLQLMRSKCLLLIIISGLFDMIVMASIGHYARKLKLGRHRLKCLLPPVLTDPLVETWSLPFQRDRYHLVFINSLVTT